jgi:hypothetical protein
LPPKTILLPGVLTPVFAGTWLASIAFFAAAMPPINDFFSAMVVSLSPFEFLLPFPGQTLMLNARGSPISFPSNTLALPREFNELQNVVFLCAMKCIWPRLKINLRWINF